MSMKALIVEDERLARNELRRMLKAFPEIEIVGEAQGVNEAVSAIERLHPDLLFLDVQIPGGDGFEVLERLDSVPRVIFTTAYDKYALKAFEVSALDYLLKPVVPERLASAIAKITSPPASPPSAASVMHASERIFVRDGERCWFVALREIVLLESEGNYTRLIFGDSRPLVLRPLNYLERRLDPAAFFRANRRQVFNVQYIRAITPWLNGGYQVELHRGLKVTMSRRQAQKFQDAKRL
jgi:two-component system, LytTR family, response regulator